MPFTCPFCEGPAAKVTQVKPSLVISHLIATFDKAGNFHLHGPVKNKILVAEFLKCIAKEAGIEIEDERAGRTTDDRPEEQEDSI